MFHLLRPVRTRSSKFWGWGLLIWALAGLSISGSTPALGDPIKAGSMTRKEPWRLSAIQGQRNIRIMLSIPYCKGGPKPTVRRIVAAERKNSVVITVYVRYPATGRTDEVSCAGVRLRFRRRVRLRAPLERRRLLDGSEQPPTARWPKAARRCNNESTI